MLRALASNRKALIALIFAMIVIGGGCTGRSGTTIETPAGASGDRRDERAGDQQSAPRTQGTQSAQGTKAAIPVTLDQKVLAKYADVGGELTARLEYLDETQEQPIVFKSGKARLEFKELPTGEKGTLSLTILEGDDVRLRGETADLVLKVGGNHIDLVLSPVDDADATIDIEIGDDGDDEGTPLGDDDDDDDEGTPLGDDDDDDQGTSLVGFARDVTPVLDKYCSSCHQGSTDARVPDISRYSVAKAQIDAMLDDIRRGTMPKGNTKVKAADVEVLKAWKADGLGQ
jgi:hypothetical protein